MDVSALQPLVHWISAHPGWAGLIIFLISCAESLAVVGAFIPGTSFFFLCVGPLIGFGILALDSTLLFAIAGAITGDCLSFWLGYHFKERLKVTWPFSQYPVLVERGEVFLRRHGGKSILFGRFMGPVRAFIPSVAGMLGMGTLRFVIIDIASAVAWACAHIFPGAVFGASLSLASEVAGRLAVLVLGLIIVIWFTLWLAHRLYLWMRPRAQSWLKRLLRWERDHKHVAPVVASVLDPKTPEIRGLMILALLLLGIAWGLIVLGNNAVINGPLLATDTAIANLMRGLRTPWADHLMVFIAQIGGFSVLLPLSLVIGLWLAWHRQWATLWHWLAGLIFVVILLVMLERGAPSAPWNHNHVVFSTAVFGLSAALFARNVTPAWRWLPYACASGLVMAIACAYLYLGASGFSHIAGGLVLTLLWVVTLGTAYRVHLPHTHAPRGLLILSIATLLLTTAWESNAHFARDLHQYSLRQNVIQIPTAVWWNSYWKRLPAYRIDMKGKEKQPLTVQWAGTLPTIALQLDRQGWHAPPPLRLTTVLGWLQPQPVLQNLPLLPQVHNGHHEALVRVHRGPGPDQLWVLRLWPAQTKLSQPAQALWIGNVTTVHPATYLHWLTVPITGQDYTVPLQALLPALSGLTQRRVARSDGTARNIRWDRTIVLVRSS